MSTFVLVHGAWHGAWCWERVASALEAAGHRALAVDLPCDDPAAGCAAYAEAVLAALDGAADPAADPDPARDPDADDLVLVGHSAGGLTIPLVAAARPVARMVFVGAFLPVVGRRFVEQDADEHVVVEGYEAGVRRDPDGGQRWVDPEVAAATMYGGCTAGDVAWAFSRLRPQGSRIYTEVSPLTAWPDVPSVDVRSPDDAVVSTAWGVRAARERLGIETRLLDGGGHSPMLSRPAELAALLATP